MDASAATKDRSPWSRSAVVAIVALALLFALHAFLATRTKTPTCDEPAHVLSSWLIVNHGDFRLSPEHPPLWRYIAGLPLIGQPLKIDLEDAQARGLLKKDVLQWYWAARVMSQTPGNDGIALVARARAMMCIFPFLLALVVGRWAWSWGGPGAGVMAVALLTFDPNLLAHAGLVTNDVPATLIFTLGAYLTWRLGTRFTAWTAVALALTCAAGVATKMSCLLLAPMVGVPLLIRALTSDAWEAGRHAIQSRLVRVAVVVGYGLGVALLAGILLWPLYLFRYEPTATHDVFNDQRERWLQAMFSVEDQVGRRYSEAERPFFLEGVQNYRPSLFDRAIYTLNDHRIIPNSWGWGYTYVRANSLSRSSFLMGDISDRGFVSYFPIAMACKAPVTTIGLSVFALGVALLRRGTLVGSAALRWKCIAIVVPPLIYTATAMAGNLNIGVRHMLPVYPMIYIGIALACVSATRSLTPRIRAVLGVAVVAALAIETTSVFPNYISYFNLIVGGSRGGFEILSDSNLDWGQDLNALADWYKPWRKANPNRPFYLSYYGTIDPHVYGIDYLNGTPGYTFAGTPLVTDMSNGIYAISASALQGLMTPDAPMRARLAMLRDAKPVAIINGTFYLYDFGPAPATRRTPPATMPTQITPAQTMPVQP